jgi:acetolactate synthase I/II/III large subunit
VTVAGVLVDGLVRAGCRRIFTSGAGGTLLEAAARRGLAVVRAVDDTAATVMAAITGRLRAAPGVAVVGAAIDAHAAALDRDPLIVLRVGPPADPIGGVKTRLVVEQSSAGHWMAQGCQLAMKAPRGPIQIDVETEILDTAALPMEATVRPAPQSPAASTLDELAGRIVAASRPVVLAGLECDEADAKWIRPFAETLPAPVVVTPRGKGALPDPHPLALGVLGGQGPARALLAMADLVIALGLDAAECRGWAPATPIVRVGRSDPVGASWAASVDVIGDIHGVLEELAARVRSRAGADWDVALLDRMKRDVARRLLAPPGMLAESRMVQLTHEATPPGTIAAVDPSGPVAEALAFWDASGPHELLLTEADRPGFGVRAAIAAAGVRPDRCPVCFTARVALDLIRPDLDLAADQGIDLLVVPSDTVGSGERDFVTQLDRALRQRGPVVVGEG